MKRVVVLFAAAVAVIVPSGADLPGAHAEGVVPAPMCAVANPLTSQAEQSPAKPVSNALCQDRLDEPEE